MFSSMLLSPSVMFFLDVFCLGLTGLARGQYAISQEVLVELGRMGSNGPAPHNNVALEVLLAPLLTLVSLGYRAWMDFVVRKAAKAQRKTN
eukprot:m.337149 g.337149  ORF g.337149 m.337149 type:complete len:91 (-) comp55711_c0_seq5:164-436(-)